MGDSIGESQGDDRSLAELSPWDAPGNPAIFGDTQVHCKHFGGCEIEQRNCSVSEFELVPLTLDLNTTLDLNNAAPPS
ncbi:hypothetical protein [Rhodopirellula bahusiensis]|uniref:hypothetical protein n=1 Tax=Rhodopirellula bahusiensis TaxID=2014065 RepID=UPI003264C157